MTEPPDLADYNEGDLARHRDTCENILGLRFFGITSSGWIKYHCPLEPDEKPHLHVSPEGRWNCFKCGVGGPALDSLAREIHGEEEGRRIYFEGRGEIIREAIATGRSERPALAEPAASVAPRVETPNALEIIEATVAHCHANLEGACREYVRGRVNDASIVRFRLGAVPDDLDRHLLTVSGFDAEECAAVGVLRRGSHFPAWSGAITIPDIADGRAQNIVYRLTDDLAVKYGRYRSLPRPRELFNRDCLSGVTEAFCTEGAWDAMTLVEHGYVAVALPSASATTAHAKLLGALDRIYSVLDTDEAGEKGRRVLEKRLKRTKVIHVRLPDGASDVNEYFRKHGGTKESFDSLVEETRRQESVELLATLNIDVFVDQVREFEVLAGKRSHREFLGLQSGFSALDRTLSGLHGVIVLGGTAGVGKTTFVLQAGWEVARINSALLGIVSLEMSRDQVMAKLFARLAEQPYERVAMGKILGGSLWDETKRAVVSFADRVFLLDQRDDLSVDRIREIVHAAKDAAGVDDAVLLVDSLQYLAARVQLPGSKTAKDSIDYVVQELEKISAKAGATVIATSHKPKSRWKSNELTSFLGSAGIDHGADVALMLSNPAEAAKEPGSEIAAGPQRRIIHVLKNRFGPQGEIEFAFDGAIGKFVEV